MIKVRVSITREIEVSPEDLAYLKEAVRTGDGQMFREVSEIDWGGAMRVEELDNGN